MNGKILSLAIPSIVSNITVPLLGLVDVAIVGHLGSASYIGAIAVGGMLFSIIYWLFGFLRMSTSGMTSQALGRRDLRETLCVLLRAVGMGLLIAFALLLLQYPCRVLAFHFIDASQEVRHTATIYFSICVWGAPAVLGLYAFVGWFIGMQNSRFPMFIAVAQNVVNIAASLVLVCLFGMKIEGVAYGTLIAQYAGLIMAWLLRLRYYGRLMKVRVAWREVLRSTAMWRFFRVSRDIFLRTLCLVAVTVFFTSAGARQGDVLLAVNTLLMQLFTLFSYVMDGFAYAGEAMTGRFMGAHNTEGLRRMVRCLFRWGWALALLFTAMYATFGKAFLALLTDDARVIGSAAAYFAWVLAIPLAGFAAFLWDGILIGATATRLMLRSMLVASASFFLLFYSFRADMGNHALWMAFIVYLALRGIVQWGLWHFHRE